ncbi:MAG TPA: AI-2E family transporter, partial [Clostridiaceae bacterium]|nr:AI-2E family transporter [Clostridiaceae bacterium]
LSILKAPYTAIISMVVGITNMIPYFGPFIGMVFGVIIVIFSSPIMALWVFIFLFLLQQFDGWYLGPKILGDMVGLNPVWIILAVILGGGLFGVAGMFLGVPVIAIIKIWIDRCIDKKLNKNKNDKSCEAIK